MTTLRRFHLFEFGDQGWIPGFLREGYHDFLGFAQAVYRPQAGLGRLISDWAALHDVKTIQDLGSGGGVPVALTLRESAAKGIALPKFILSDLYPLPKEWRRLAAEFGPDRLDYVSEPVSALNLRDLRARHLSIFNAFHHFSPIVARQMMEECLTRADSLMIYELAPRRWDGLIMQILIGFVSAAALGLVSPFFARRFSLGKFLLTSILPVVPLMFWIDAMVSSVRVYTREEILDMTPQALRQDFDLDYHLSPWPFMPVRAMLLILTRKQAVSQ